MPALEEPRRAASTEKRSKIRLGSRPAIPARFVLSERKYQHRVQPPRIQSVAHAVLTSTGKAGHRVVELALMARILTPDLRHAAHVQEENTLMHQLDRV